MEWMILPLKRYATFTGRAQRKELWMFVLFVILVTLALSVVDSVLGLGGSTRTDSSAVPGQYAYAAHTSGGVLTTIFSLGVLLPNLAVQVRRLHDTDRAGYYLLVSFIPLVNLVLMLIWGCQAGTRGTNQFGPDPLGDEAGLLPGRAVAGTSAVTGASAAPAARDVVGELELLASLHSQGRLSDAEFADLKARTLSTGDVA